MYGKEFEGVVRSTVLIDPKGTVKAAWPKASSKGHAAEVLEALQRLAGYDFDESITLQLFFCGSGILPRYYRCRSRSRVIFSGLPRSMRSDP